MPGTGWIVSGPPSLSMSLAAFLTGGRFTRSSKWLRQMSCRMGYPDLLPVELSVLLRNGRWKSMTSSTFTIYHPPSAFIRWRGWPGVNPYSGPCTIAAGSRPGVFILELAIVFNADAGLVRSWGSGPWIPPETKRQVCTESNGVSGQKSGLFPSFLPNG